MRGRFALLFTFKGKYAIINIRIGFIKTKTNIFISYFIIFSLAMEFVNTACFHAIEKWHPGLVSCRSLSRRAPTQSRLRFHRGRGHGDAGQE